MKTHKNQNKLIKSKSYKILLLTLSLFLAACDGEIPASAQHKGRLYAGSLSAEIHNKYFSYYTFDLKDKELCYAALNKAYIDDSKQKDKEYIKGFIEEIERLGFKHFLQARGLPCSSIEQNPKFIEDKKAYLVVCKSIDQNSYQKQYLLRFDYDNRKWEILLENNKVLEVSHD